MGSTRHASTQDPSTRHLVSTYMATYSIQNKDRFIPLSGLLQLETTSSSRLPAGVPYSSGMISNLNPSTGRGSPNYCQGPEADPRQLVSRVLNTRRTRRMSASPRPSSRSWWVTGFVIDTTICFTCQ